MLHGWAKLTNYVGIFEKGQPVVLSTSEESDCVICYEKTKSVTNCSHYICFSCIRKYLKTNRQRFQCPYCRSSLAESFTQVLPIPIRNIDGRYSHTSTPIPQMVGEVL